MLDLWCEVILATLMSYVRALCWVYADKYLVDAGGHMYRRKTGHPIVGDKEVPCACLFVGRFIHSCMPSSVLYKMLLLISIQLRMYTHFVR